MELRVVLNGSDLVVCIRGMAAVACAGIQPGPLPLSPIIICVVLSPFQMCEKCDNKSHRNNLNSFLAEKHLQPLRNPWTSSRTAGTLQVDGILWKAKHFIFIVQFVLTCWVKVLIRLTELLLLPSRHRPNRNMCWVDENQTIHSHWAPHKAIFVLINSYQI